MDEKTKLSPEDIEALSKSSICGDLWIPMFFASMMGFSNPGNSETRLSMLEGKVDTLEKIVGGKR